MQWEYILAIVETLSVYVKLQASVMEAILDINTNYLNLNR